MIWYLIICNALLRKTRQVIWDALQYGGGIEWKHILKDLAKVPHVAYHDILNKFDSTWRVKGLIVTWSNLVVTWKVRLQMSTISWFPLGLHWFTRSGCILDSFLQLNFQSVPYMYLSISFLMSYKILVSTLRVYHACNLWDNVSEETRGGTQHQFPREISHVAWGIIIRQRNWNLHFTREQQSRWLVNLSKSSPRWPTRLST